MFNHIKYTEYRRNYFADNVFFTRNSRALKEEKKERGGRKW